MHAFNWPSDQIQSVLVCIRHKKSDFTYHHKDDLPEGDGRIVHTETDKSRNDLVHQHKKSLRMEGEKKEKKINMEIKLQTERSRKTHKHKLVREKIYIKTYLKKMLHKSLLFPNNLHKNSIH